jgi:hypothetical protein
MALVVDSVDGIPELTNRERMAADQFFLLFDEERKLETALARDLPKAGRKTRPKTGGQFESKSS